MCEHTEIIGRINFYVRQKGGNKSALARDWGISPSHLGVVMKGTRQVSSTMLKNANDNGYNTDWLLTGQGEPYLPTSSKEEPTPDYRDELLASKDKVIALLEEKNSLLEHQLKKDRGVATRFTNSKIVPLRTTNVIM
jgi:hypothetical protein